MDIPAPNPSRHARRATSRAPVVVDITSFCSAVCGGIKTYYHEKARGLSALGYCCHFVVPGERTETDELAGQPLHRIAGPTLPGTEHYRAFGDLPALRRTLRALDPDIIEIGSHYLLPHLVRGLARPRAALVGFYHADFPGTYVAPALPTALRGAGTAAAWSLVRWQHRRYRATLVGSRHIAGTLRRRGVPHVRWVGLGVDTALFRPRPRAERAHPRVVYAGRLSRDKDVGLIMAAFDAVHARTGAELIIAGDGPLAGELAAWAARRDHVTVIGYVADRGLLAAIVADADVAIAPGRNESFSLAAAEALACGTPVVGADRAGNAELVRASGAGALFTAGSATALATALCELLVGGEPRRAALGRKGRAHVDGSLRWSHVLARIDAVYREVLGVGPRRLQPAAPPAHTADTGLHPGEARAC